MSRPDRPRRSPAGFAALLPLLLLSLAAPTAASADYASANTWAGGTAGQGRSTLTGRNYAARGALVSMVTSPSRARLAVSVRSDRCVANGTLRGTIVPQAGGVGDLLALGVRARGTVTTSGSHGRTRARVTLDLAPAAPGVLVGTVRAEGRVTRNGRRRACRMRESVTLRSRAALGTPGAFSTDPLALRTGIVESRIAPRVPGSIALIGRADGAVHGFWRIHVSCRSGSKRSADDVVNLNRRFRVRADGGFRDREVFVSRTRVKGGTRVIRFVATISGRIAADGVARGRVRLQTRDREPGYLDLVCSSPSVPFTAAPVR
jgi:hypothetical protein